MGLQLFHRWQCPYSASVRDFIEANGLESHIEYIEINEVQGAEEQVLELTGKAQVPCLVIDGSPLLESRVIIHWLRHTFIKARVENPQPTLAP